MDGNGNMNLRNWRILDPPTSTLNSNLDLQLITSMAEKPLFGGGVRPHPSPVMASINGGPLHHHLVGGVSEPHIPIDYWMNQNRDKYIDMISGINQHPFYQSSYGVSPETSSVHSVPMPRQVAVHKNDNVMPEMENMCEERDDCGGDGSGNGSSGAPSVKKRHGGKIQDLTPKEKKSRPKAHRARKDELTPSSNRARTPKKRAEIVINGINMDISEIPIPVCSCTGTPQQCYRWGSGGWQSACCTMVLSVYPLPMSTKRRGSRIAGRKMSIGAFKKVLEKVTSEGYDFSSPIDLRTHWAKHGTNKFVTIR